MLDTFFDTMGSNHFDSNDYIFEKPMISKQEADASFAWAEELPPTFHGSTTSLPQTAMLSHGLSNAGYGGKEGVMQTPQEPKMTSAEVLAAASTLVRNGQNIQINGLFGGSMFPAPDVGDRTQEITNIGSSSGAQRLGSYSNMLPALTEQLPSGFPQAKATSAVASGETLFHDMYFGTSGQIRGTVSHTSKPPEIQWGSDVSFLDHGYVAPPNQETEEEVTKTLMHKMECFEPQGSANTTRPSSPVISQRRWQPKGTTSDDGLGADSARSNDEGAEKKPRLTRKRRKTQHKHDENSSGDTDHKNAKLKHNTVGPNGKGGRQRRSTASDSLSKRRKSQSGEPKPNRENLSEEQKRSNHILSEQKRRNLIKQGFEDLCKLVPELKGGGFSKSAMLIQAADWLEDVIRGNEVLKAQLAGLEHRRTA